jgi:hypothetical protein
VDERIDKSNSFFFNATTTSGTVLLLSTAKSEAPLARAIEVTGRTALSLRTSCT